MFHSNDVYILQSTISTPLWVAGGNVMLANAMHSKNKTKTIQNYVANQICGMRGCVHQTFGCSAQESAGQFYMLEERLELLENTLENPAATGVEGQIQDNVELCIHMQDQDSILIIVNI